jgi:hypothetical protein
MYTQSVAEAAATVRVWGYFSFGVMVFAAVLMNLYPIHYLHYGRFMNRHPIFVSLTLIVGFVFVFTPFFGEFCLICMGIYLVSPLWTWRVDPNIAASESRTG